MGPRRFHTQRGVTIMDLMLTLIIASLLLAVAVPAYDRYTQRAKVSKAIGDIGYISLAIDRFRLRNRDRVPMSLDELNIDIPEDPWGQPYVFLNIIDGDSNTGAVRKDGRLNPLNTDYDLYSIGKDGDSSTALNAGPSRDDIVRANDGAFVGLGEDY